MESLAPLVAAGLSLLVGFASLPHGLLSEFGHGALLWECGMPRSFGPCWLVTFASFSLGTVILLRHPSGFGLLACIAMFVSAWFSLHSFALCWWGLLAFRCLCAFDLWEW